MNEETRQPNGREPPLRGHPQGDLPGPAADVEHGIGPILFWRGLDGDRLHLAALFARAPDRPAPRVEADGALLDPEPLHERAGWRLLRYCFSVPASAAASYLVDGAAYPIRADFGGDLRLGYISCNGQEAGDRDRDPDERNCLWQRLAAQHAERPFQLLLHGGDQIYADEMLQVHPAARRWDASHRRDVATMELPQAARDGLRDYLFGRYMELYGQGAPAWLMARVPSLAMWDDHDICDGWGSLPTPKLDAPAGRDVFAVAREFFLLFQCGATPDEPLPAMCRDRTGETLSWDVALPGLHIVAPDLRSERRPDRVMGERGWSVLEQQLGDVHDGRLLLLSSVPALGPRLSWVERAMQLIPRMQALEDDLRDQWQSRAHRGEWRRFLQHLLAVHERPGTRVTALSGEIHLATRATMAAADGPLHQLVASGIAHPPPPAAYARTLGALARLGEAPLRGHPIRLHPLPGQRTIYAAQRNYLVLERSAGRWQAHWELERDGATPALDLGG